MERTGADGGSRAGGGARADDARRQAHHCRFSIGGLDPAGQYHDARAGDHRGAGGTARAGPGECTAAVSASGSHHNDYGDRARSTGSTNRGQEAGCTEVLTRWSGSTCARCGGARGRRRVMLPKSGAGR